MLSRTGCGRMCHWCGEADEKTWVVEWPAVQVDDDGLRAGLYLTLRRPKRCAAARARPCAPQALLPNPGRVRHQLRPAARSLSALEPLVVDTHVRRRVQVDPHRAIREQLRPHQLGLD